MAIAHLAAERSKDPITQVGACIVDKDPNIVGIGYNHMSKRIPDDANRWGNKYFRVLNAILHGNSFNLQDYRVYTSLFPDHKGAQAIIQSKIKIKITCLTK